MTISLEVGTGSAGLGLVLAAPVRRGGILLEFDDGVPRDEPSIYTVQVGRTRHVHSEKIRYLNHSCVPNSIVDTETRAVVAARDIEGGEELTYFYPSTEWDMVGPFTCDCGVPRCLRLIRGARHLPADFAWPVRANEHIRNLLAERRDVVAPPTNPRQRV
jgi:SET domain-containing protein